MFHRPHLNNEDVAAAYQVLLGREPESLAVIEHHKRSGTIGRVLAEIANSVEFKDKNKNHAFYYYNASFDVIDTIRRHAAQNITPHPAYITNFLGVRVSPIVCPAMLQGHAGELEAIPIPGNWHADMAEVAAVLRSVDLATGTFNMAELGCGWGCWMNNAGSAAKRLGLHVMLTGVEADEGHIRLAEETLALNGFSPNEVKLLWGISAPSQGVALFPNQSTPGQNWGLEPIFNPDAVARTNALETGSHRELPMIPLSQLLDGTRSRLDLLHIDIQGGEADLVHASLDLMSAHIGYVVIGTHSREIEGRLFSDFLSAGWHLEIERPAILNLQAKPKVVIDGVQGWRNPVLAPSAGTL